MSKVIKIQNNLKVSPAYAANNIESVFVDDMEQQIKYQILDEYTLPFGTYLILRNYDDILFDIATLQSADNSTFAILQSSEVPDCESMYNLFNQYYSPTNKCKGIVVISTSEETYNQIVVTAEQISDTDDYRITNIELKGDYSTLAEAEQELQDENPVIIDFDDVYSKCAKYWKVSANNTKTSAFDTGDGPQDPSLHILPSFDGGFGEYEYDSGSGSGEEYNAEWWSKFSNNSTISDDDFIFRGGKYYMSTSEGSDNGLSVQSYKIKDSDYNIYDVLFRYIYDYLYDRNPDYNPNTTTPDPYVVKDPSTYTFLLKTYKMYVKTDATYMSELRTLFEESGSYNGSNNGSNNESAVIYNPNVLSGGKYGRGNGNNLFIPTGLFDDSSSDTSDIVNSVISYSTKILSIDDIKELSAEEAQEYFDNTIVYDNAAYKDKLILSENEAKEVLLTKGISTCNKYFLISSNVGIKSPSAVQYEYYDLGNFELVYETSSNGIISRNVYKYNTNGKVVRIRQIYDPYTNEYYTISQNNSGEFAEGYGVDRKGVCITCISGKTDYYYFENSDEGEVFAEQLKEDILYAIDEGPSIVATENLVNIEY